MSKATENIIVIIIMVAIVIGLLCFVGFNNIRFWLTSPIEWDEPDYIQIMLVGKEENYGNMELEFLVRNGSSYRFSDYEFYVTSGNSTVTVSSFMNNDLLPNDFTSVCYSFAQEGSVGYFFDELQGLDVEDIEMEYRIKSLTANHEKIVDNRSWIKIIIILAISLIAGILVLNDVARVTWLRIIMKIACVPAILIILVVGFVFLAGGGSSSSRSTNDSQYNSAQQRYNRAANQKAGAIKTGNTHSAAKAQEEMDRAMADMITAKGSGSSSAREAAARYKQAANWKAGAAITGRAGDAARAQASMDSALTDMVKEK